MDAEINKEGNFLYYVNAKFSGKLLPDESVIGIAEKMGNLFKKIKKSKNDLKNINYSNYLVYAPSISADNKELYFTRIKKSTYITEICVAIRTDQDTIFSNPKKISISGNTVETPSITLDGSRLYYHKKLKKDGKYHIFTMKRKYPILFILF